MTGEPHRIDAGEARRLLEDEGYTYLDVRTEAEFLRGRPAGAVNIPAFRKGPAGMEQNPEFQAQVEARFATDAPLVVGCARGGRSFYAAQVLEQAGFTNVVDMACGFLGMRGPLGNPIMPGWVDLGYPVETGDDSPYP